MLALMVVGLASCSRPAPTAARAQDARNAAAEIVYEEDVVYGTGKIADGSAKELHLDYARPKTGEGPFPTVVCIHGGGWRGGNRQVYRPLIKELAKRGYVAVTVQYRLVPEARFPSQVEDVKCAVRFLRANAERLKVDPERIGAIGASAGGHLSLMLGVMGDDDGLEGEGGHSGHSSRVQAVVNYYGPTDLRKPYPPQIEPILTEFLGGKASDKPDAARRSSPINYLSEDDAPILTFHGTADRVVPYDQATLLDEASREKKVRHELVTYQDAGHGWGGADLLDSLERSYRFFDKHLKRE